MPDAKLIVMYPLPKHVEQFENVDHNEHVPIAVARLAGKTKIVGTRVLGSDQGTSRFHRIAEIHFPSMDVLKACAASPGGQQVLENAMSISTGGPPVILIVEEERSILGGECETKA